LPCHQPNWRLTPRVEFDEDVTEERWGLTTSLKLPGGGQLGLYEPRHPSPLLSDRDQAEPTG